MPKTLPKGLPPPPPEAQAQSERLESLIRDEIAVSGGRISFARYMALALYAPGLGYYSGGTRKFGQAGDFVTAPEISALFSRCLARQTAQVLAETGGDMLEFGAGTGVMAADILTELESLGQLPERYAILELSGDLRARQQETVAAKVPHLVERVSWLNALPDPGFRGVVLANEVLDAMPVHRVLLEDGADKEIYVGWGEDGFEWITGEPGEPRLTERFGIIRDAIGGRWQGRYESEVSLAADGWVNSVAEVLAEGAVFIIDYGFPRHEFYHPQRDRGTIMCHYRHRAHDDPLILPGLQDITAHVDFTAVAEAAVNAGLDVAGYTTQAYFLMATGLESLLNEIDPEDTERYFRATQQVKKLTLPSEMGELFKVIALTRGFDHPLMGYAFQDQRARL